MVHEADALELDLARIAPPPRPLRVTGNLPYNISTPLVFRLLTALPRITDMHLMLQREVVDRMVSPPGTRTYGRLSVMVQLDCEVERVLRVGSGAFSPPPRVESAVVRLRPPGLSRSSTPRAETDSKPSSDRAFPNDARRCATRCAACATNR